MNGKRMSITRDRANGGFTMVEMLVAVGILVILMGVAFVAVINYQRSMKRLELDQTAKEIFIAAQNHLTVAESKGVLKDVDASDTNKVGDQEEGSSTTIRYWYVGTDKSQLTTANKSLLYEMLPFASIDDTVRLNGSYVIEYDLKTAMVLNVFFSDQSSLSQHVFTKDDHSQLYPGMQGEANEAARMDAFGGQIIGWYGGDDLESRTSKRLYAPAVKLTNAERLEVKATFTSTDRMSNANVNGAKMRIILRGDTSRHSKVVASDVLVSSIPANGTVYSATYVLDDITQASEHFANKWCDASPLSAQAAKASEGGPLIPGENISVYAEVYSNDTLSTIAKSSIKHTNSLFAGMISEKPEGESEAVRVATISNIRHLENLDAAISGYDLTSLGKDGATKAKQVSDLRWMSTNSKKPVGFANAIAASTGASAENVRVYALDSTSSKPGTFAPVTPRSKGSSTSGGYEQFALTYDGNKKKISDVKIDVEASGAAAANAGIFATLMSGSSVKSLELVDCSVKTSNGSAGILLGEASGTLELTDVLAHDTTATVGSKVVGTVGVGGLAGHLIGGSSGSGVKVDGCAAAVLVGADGSGAAAGGLIGATNNRVTVTNSYAGGHTKDAMYETYDTNNNRVFNVTAANGAAGGLVGVVFNSGATIENCYATTSVSGRLAAGGLVATAEGAKIANCYATGLVDNRAVQKGAFAAGLDQATLDQLQGNYYYEIINGSMAPVHDDESATIEVEASKLVAFDKDLQTFAAFYGDDTLRTATEKAEDPDVAGTPPASDGTGDATAAKRVDKSVPYDAELTKLYGDVYPLRTIAMLNSEAKGAWATSHYGDWPAPETLVVNVEGGAIKDE